MEEGEAGLIYIQTKHGKKSVQLRGRGTGMGCVNKRESPGAGWNKEHRAKGWELRQPALGGECPARPCIGNANELGPLSTNEDRRKPGKRNIAVSKTRETVKRHQSLSVERKGPGRGSPAEYETQNKRPGRAMSMEIRRYAKGRLRAETASAKSSRWVGFGQYHSGGGVTDIARRFLPRGGTDLKAAPRRERAAAEKSAVVNVKPSRPLYDESPLVGQSPKGRRPAVACLAASWIYGVVSTIHWVFPASSHPACCSRWIPRPPSALFLSGKAGSSTLNNISVSKCVVSYRESDGYDIPPDVGDFLYKTSD
ncbi:hypothetical protein C8F04DRAFT_1188372 [Mycena alexandri]|uniref:Uncharacterized protein n=1 Tax=Mycena alexandri TaxID=1745969 RepID=A0AAD6SK68_9AGAR|nr:hypothetical protein C8F04DRAFT_1188372 [Mycena alexandri]